MQNNRQIWMVAAGLILALLVGFSFMGGDTAPQRLSDKSGVIFSAPPGYAVFESTIVIDGDNYQAVASRVQEILQTSHLLQYFSTSENVSTAVSEFEPNE